MPKNLLPKYERRRNTIYSHNRNETLKHLVVKTILFHALRAKNRTVFTECTVNEAIVDVLDDTENIAYELESNPKPNTWKAKQVLINPYNNHAMPTVRVIDLRDFSMDVDEIYEYFEELT